MPDHTVGDILRAERQRRRLSQAEAGALVGYSSSTLSRIERGDRRLHIEELRRLADRYGIAPARLGLATVGINPSSMRAVTTCSAGSSSSRPPG